MQLRTSRQIQRRCLLDEASRGMPGSGSASSRSPPRHGPGTWARWASNANAVPRRSSVPMPSAAGEPQEPLERGERVTGRGGGLAGPAARKAFTGATRSSGVPGPPYPGVGDRPGSCSSRATSPFSRSSPRLRPASRGGAVAAAHRGRSPQLVVPHHVVVLTRSRGLRGECRVRRRGSVRRVVVPGCSTLRMFGHGRARASGLVADVEPVEGRRARPASGARPAGPPWALGGPDDPGLAHLPTITAGWRGQTGRAARSDLEVRRVASLRAIGGPGPSPSSACRRRVGGPAARTSTPRQSARVRRLGTATATLARAQAHLGQRTSVDGDGGPGEPHRRVAALDDPHSDPRHGRFQQVVGDQQRRERHHDGGQAGAATGTTSG